MSTISPSSTAPHVGKYIEAMRADLVPWAAAYTPPGVVTVARDPFNALEMLSITENDWRIVLHWEGNAESGQPYLKSQRGIAENTIKVAVGLNPGLSVVPDQDTFAPYAGGTGKTLAELVGEVRRRILALRFPETYILYGLLFHKSTGPVTVPQGIPLRAYEMTFVFIADYPIPTSGVYPSDPLGLVTLTIT